MLKKKSKTVCKISNPITVRKNGAVYLKDKDSGYMLKYDLFLKYVSNNK